MIFDFAIAKYVDTLNEYYKELRKLHSKSHGDDYILVHDEIKMKLNNCDSYSELGVNQGATLAAALLENPKIVKGYDIALGPYNFAKHLFNKYALENDINLFVHEANTLDINLDFVDLLYIDTRHEYNHLVKELKLHGHKAQKYIIFHDTYTQPGLKKAVQEYIQKNKQWEIDTECCQNVGFMTIKRK